jgi:hypothetical protein
MACGAISHVKRRARQPAPSAPTCKPRWSLWGCFSYLKIGFGASVLQRRKESRGSPGVGNLRTLSYGGRGFLIAGHVGPRSRIFWRQISGQNVRKSRRKGIATTNTTTRWKPPPPAGLAPPVLPSQTKNEQHRLVAHLAKIGRYRVDVERVAVQPILAGLLAIT